MKNILRLVVTLVMLLPGPVFAAHPLITDDSGTQGKGKFQFELNGERSRDNDGNGEVEISTEVAASLTYGINDTLDLSVGVPSQKSDLDDLGVTTSNSGLGDASIALKWRFLEHEATSFAIKPQIMLPTGDYDKGLGNGRTGWGLFLISTTEMKPVAVHVNLGYIRNESKSPDRVDLWHASLAGEYSVAPSLRLVANLGTDTNPQQESVTNPAFLIGGIIYSITESFEVDLGLKSGLNKAEPDTAVLAGITARW